MKHILPLSFALSAAFAVALAATAPGATADPEKPDSFSDEERDLVRQLAADVAEAMRESAIPTDQPIAILPLGGDRGDYALGQFKNSVTDAGRNCVEGRLDPMWETIASEIHWNDVMTRSGALDPALLTSLGKLQGARMLLYGGIIPSTTKDGRARLELSLHVNHVLTKQHLWGKSFVREEPPPSPPTNELIFVDFPVALIEAPLSVHVKAETRDAKTPSRSFAEALETEAAGALAKSGFAVVPNAADAEAEVVIQASASAFAREQAYVVFDGTATVTASLAADRNRLLGRKSFECRGSRGLGDAAALRNLLSETSPLLDDWLADTVTPEKAGIHKTSLQIDFATPSEPERQQLAKTLLAALSDLPGVRDARLVSELPLENGSPGRRVTFRVSHRPADLPEGLVPALTARRPDLFRRTVDAPVHAPAQ